MKNTSYTIATANPTNRTKQYLKLELHVPSRLTLTLTWSRNRNRWNRLARGRFTCHTSTILTPSNAIKPNQLSRISQISQLKQLS